MKKLLSVIIFLSLIIHFEAWSQPGCDATLCAICQDDSPSGVIDNNGIHYSTYNGISGCYTANVVGDGSYTDPADCQSRLCNSNIPINTDSWALIPVGISVVAIGWVMGRNRKK